MTDSHLLLPLLFASNPSQRITRDISHTLLQFLNNLIYNSTTPLSFETYPEDIYTTPLIREHHDPYLYYIATHSLLPNSDEPPFSIPFTSPTTDCDTFQKNIHPNNIQIPIAHVFTTFLNNLQEKNNVLPKHVFNPSSIQELLQKESLFDLPNIEQFRTIENNPHYWLITDLLQIHHFQYQFFQNITLNKNTKEQIQIYSLFLRKFFRHNYQLIWHSKFQNACKNFPQQFTTDELLPFLDTPDNQHPHYYNLLDFPSSHFVYLTYDSNSIDKSLNLPPPVRPYFHQSNIPPSNETISTASIQTLSSSSHSVTNPTSSSTQHISPPTSQDTSLNHNNPPSTSQITTIHNNPPLSHSPNQYTTPSNTPPAVISNPVLHSTFQIPSLNPIPLLNPPNSLPPTSTLSSNPSSSYPSFPFPTTPSVPFAALSDPIKLFDGLDHTYPPEKFLAHLSARVTFQLGPQPVDIHSYLTWHSRRMSLLYCSLTGTASNWYDRLPQVYKDDWSSFLQIFKKQFYSQNTHIMLKLKPFPFLKRIMKISVTSLLKSKPL